MRLPLRLTARPRRPVVDQTVDRLLQHALFVADDDIGRAEVEQTLETVIAVDHAAVKVVEVAGCEPPAVQLHHRAQFRRNNRQRRQDHPFGPVAALAEVLDNAQAFGRFFAALFALGFFDFLAQLLCQRLQVDLGDDIANRFGAHACLEDIAPAVGQFAVARLGQELLFLQTFQFLNLHFNFFLQFLQFFG